MRGKPELDEPAEGDAATSIDGWEVATSPPAAPPAQAAVVPNHGLRPEFNADAVLGFQRGRCRSARASPRGVQMSLGEARAAPGRDAAPDQSRARLANDLTNGRN
jgi:hypothetical protein